MILWAWEWGNYLLFLERKRNAFLYWCSWFIPKLWMISLLMSQCLYHWHHMVTGKIKWKKMFSFSYWSNHVVLIKSSKSIEWEGLCCLVCQTSYFSIHSFVAALRRLGEKKKHGCWKKAGEIETKELALLKEMRSFTFTQQIGCRH